jgi:hypothetical protein
MNLRNFWFVLFLSITTILTGCGSEPAANTGNSAANTNTANAPKTNTNNPVAVTTPTPDQVTNNAPTLTPVYKAYCAAVVKKDDAAIRKFFDAATLKEFEKQMKDENITRLSEYVDPVTNEVCEVANERFKGDRAVARVITKSYPAPGYEVLWIKENGEWKMSSLDPKIGFQ